MKTLLGLLPLALGAGLVGLIIKIQSDPFAFTTPQASESTMAPAPAELHATQLESRGSNVVVLEDVTVTGRALPLRHRKLARSAGHLARERSARRVAKPRVTVIPAPCVNGEYRKLEAHRGVRLMCSP